MSKRNGLSLGPCLDSPFFYPPNSGAHSLPPNTSRRTILGFPASWALRQRRRCLGTHWECHLLFGLTTHLSRDQRFVLYAHKKAGLDIRSQPPGVPRLRRSPLTCWVIIHPFLVGRKVKALASSTTILEFEACSQGLAGYLGLDAVRAWPFAVT